MSLLRSNGWCRMHVVYVDSQYFQQLPIALGLFEKGVNLINSVRYRKTSNRSPLENSSA